MTINIVHPGPEAGLGRLGSLVGAG